MSDTFRDVTRTSWFARVGRSFVGVLVGLLLIVVMVIGLFWNEGRAVTTARSLAEGAGMVVSIPATSVDPTNAGKLVHVSGAVTADDEPLDPAFGLRVAGVRLERKAEMYQWVERSSSETTTKLGGDQETVTTYTYAREWASRPVDSSDFRKPQGHANPPMPYRSETFQIPSAGLGAFTLDERVLSRIGDASDLALSQPLRRDIREGFGSDSLRFSGSGVYLGRDPAAPAIGDVRISWAIVPLGTVSVVAAQSGVSLAPFQTKAGDRILLVENGSVAPDAMFATAVSDNTVLTWVLRAAGLVLLAVGFALAMAPLGVVLDVIPFLGSMARMGTGIAAVALAVLVGGTAIALAWFWYRPLLTLAILGGAFLIAFALGRLGRARAAAAPAG